MCCFSSSQREYKFYIPGFAQAYILYEDFEIIGALFSGMKDRDVNTLTQLSPTDKSCYVYRSRSTPQVLVCLCNTEVEPEQSYSWVTQVCSDSGTDKVVLDDNSGIIFHIYAPNF